MSHLCVRYVGTMNVRCCVSVFLGSLILSIFGVLNDSNGDQIKLQPITLQVDWPSFISHQDPVWSRMPENYFEGPFVGNGLVGAILFRDDKNTNSIRIQIGRTDVYDHRPEAGSPMHYCGRLPIGHLLMTPVGAITSTSLRMDLWNAEITRHSKDPFSGRST